MKRVRTLLGGFAFATVVVAVACSFPDVTFEDDPSVVEAGSDVDAPGDGAGDGAPDASIVDANVLDVEEGVTLDDAAVTPIDASGCTVCDCDGDDYDRLDLDAGCDGGGVKKGVDCDDTIEGINPGIGYVRNPWPSATYLVVGDWNCDGKVDPEFTGNVTCGLLGLLCTGGSGFSGAPQCGGAGQFVKCEGLPPLLCAAKPDGERQQGCR